MRVRVLRDVEILLNLAPGVREERRMAGSALGAAADAFDVERAGLDRILGLCPALRRAGGIDPLTHRHESVILFI